MRSDVRHQLKRDRFAETTTDTMHWAVEHRSKLILYGSIVALVVVLALTFLAVRRSQEQQAGVALAAAMDIYSSPIVPPGTPAQPGLTTYNSAKDRAAAANAEFRKVADKYSTGSGKIARYMEGVTYGEMGDYPNAEKELKDVAGNGSSDLANLARMALASVYRQSNRDQNAIDVYQQIEAHPSASVGKTTAELELASMYSAKQPDKAKSLLQQIAKENPDTTIAQVANERLAAIK